ncbi:hypothetical protein Ancab_013039 [Ancistrocladus abbreviatus]
MDSGDQWNARLSASSKRFQSRSDVFLGGDDVAEVDDDYKQEFLCPFCAEEFDIVGLFCHIDEEHLAEVRNGFVQVRRDAVTLHQSLLPVVVFFIFRFSLVCSVLGFGSGFTFMKVGVSVSRPPFYLCVNALYYILMGRVEIPYGISLTKRSRAAQEEIAQRWAYLHVLPTEEGLRDVNRQSLLGNSSYGLAPSNSDPDPLLSSFMYSSPVAELRTGEPRSSADTSSTKKASDENNEESAGRPLLSVKEQEEKARKCKFVQGLLLSTILDDF